MGLPVGRGRPPRGHRHEPRCQGLRRSGGADRGHRGRHCAHLHTLPASPPPQGPPRKHRLRGQGAAGLQRDLRARGGGGVRERTASPLPPFFFFLKKKKTHKKKKKKKKK